MAEGTIEEQLGDFHRHLRLKKRQASTVAVYTETLRDFARFAGDPDVTDVTRHMVEDYILASMEERASATVATQFARLRRFFNWLVEEEVIAANPMTRIPKPAVEDKPKPILSVDAVRALLDTCRGDSFEHRRDTAIIVLYYDTGARRSEIADLKLDDVDLDQQLLTMRVKGGRVRPVGYADTAAQALSRYLRARRKHPSANLDWLWLGARGRLHSNGIRLMLARRGKEVGIHVHAHLFRHAFAHEWLASQGQEGDLMRLMGWRDRRMLDRYGAAAAEARASAAHARLSPADRLRS